MKTKERGITLIALVVTIIVLLILAGISIQMITGETGLLGMAKNSVDKYEISSEKEYLEQNIISVQAQKHMDNEVFEKVGEPLYDKNVDNTLIWHTIKLNNKTYGTNWNLIEEGTELKEYGSAKYNWLINYETGEIIKIEDEYISLSAGDVVAVKDSLIINVDSSIVDDEVKENKEELQKRFGDGAELVGFDFSGNSEESGLTEKSFNFDGKDDYIDIPFNIMEKKQQLAKMGFTFEFYGSIERGSIIGTDGIELNMPTSWIGVLNMVNKNKPDDTESYRGLRLGLDFEGELVFDIGTLRDENYKSSFSTFPGYANDQIIAFDENIYGKEIYITITVDPSEEITEEKITGYREKIFMNGKVYKSGVLQKDQWNDFIANTLTNANSLQFGRTRYTAPERWTYTKSKVYSMRMYYRALSEQEVKLNYETVTDILSE